MKRYIIAALLLAATASIQAGNRNEATMRSIATRQLKDIGIESNVNCVMARETFNVYEAPQGGFVVVSKNDQSEAILGYSKTAFPPADKLPCGFRWWLDATDEALANGQVKLAVGTSNKPIVDNFLPSTWGQSEPYNDLCPKINGELPPCGCVATAMGQAMNYFMYPAKGQGVGSYFIGGKETSVTVEGTYDWSLVSRDLLTIAPFMKANIKNVVSTLLRDCGYAVHMQYAATGSGAYDYDAALALARNFQYDSLSLGYHFRTFYSNDEWASLIETEMRAKRPILYSAADRSQGGHAFVFCGLDKKKNVYVNWGWESSCDGWYSVDQLQPDGTSYNFSTQQSMITGLKPQATPDASEEYHSKWHTYYAQMGLSANGRSLYVSRYLLYNGHFIPFTGTVGVLFEPVDGEGVSTLVAIEEMESSPIGALNGYESDTSVSVSLDEVPAGNYQVYWASQADGERAPQKMSTTGGLTNIPTAYVLKDTNGTITTSTRPIVSGIATVSSSQSATGKSYSPDGRPAPAHIKGIRIQNGKKYMFPAHGS